MCAPLAVLAPIIGGALAAGGSVVNGVMSSKAAGDQKDQAGQAMDLQRQVYAQQQKNYEQGREDMRPWLEAGQGTLGELMAQMQGGMFDRKFDPSQLANDPGYQFRMAEGQKALERSASARGLLNSGGALKSLSRYSQGVASDEFQNAWNRNQAENTGRYNRMANIAGYGQTAGQSLGSLGANNSAQMGQYANNMGSLYGAMGNAQSAGQVGIGNAINGAGSSMGSLGMMYGMGMFGGGGNGGSSGGGGIPTQSSPSYGPGNGYGGFSNGYVPSFGFGLNYGGNQ